MGKFRQLLTELSAHQTSVFSFLDDNFSKYRWIYTKLGMCIGIVETLFGIADSSLDTDQSFLLLILIWASLFT